MELAVRVIVQQNGGGSKGRRVGPGRCPDHRQDACGRRRFGAELSRLGVQQARGIEPFRELQPLPSSAGAVVSFLNRNEDTSLGLQAADASCQRLIAIR